MLQYNKNVSSNCTNQTKEANTAVTAAVVQEQALERNAFGNFRYFSIKSKKAKALSPGPKSGRKVTTLADKNCMVTVAHYN